MSAVLIVLAIIALAAITAYTWPRRTRWMLQNIIFARKVVFGVAAVVVAFIFIGTGWWPLILIGAFTFLVLGWMGYFRLRDAGVRI